MKNPIKWLDDLLAQDEVVVDGADLLPSEAFAKADKHYSWVAPYGVITNDVRWRYYACKEFSDAAITAMLRAAALRADSRRSIHLLKAAGRGGRPNTVVFGVALRYNEDVDEFDVALSAHVRNLTKEEFEELCSASEDWEGTSVRGSLTEDGVVSNVTTYTRPEDTLS